MAVNKVVYGTNTIMDITSTTAVDTDVLSGETYFRQDGTQGTGSLVIQHYYTGTTAPASSLGENGDIYLKVVS